jgi:hypothetical protein
VVEQDTQTPLKLGVGERTVLDGCASAVVVYWMYSTYIQMGIFIPSSILL